MNSFFFDSDPFGASGGAVDNDEYYETLGVSKDATAKELRRAYLKLSLKHHPDKGGDVEEFKKITEAHEVLSDPVKRNNYDKFGKKGAAGSPFGRGGGGSPEDMFSSMFGGGRRRRGGRGGGGGAHQEEEGGLRKEKSITHPVHVTLEELYVGKKVTLKITRKIIASVTTPKDPVPIQKLRDAFSVCLACNGRGASVKMQHLAPGVVQQMSMPCRQCNRTGMGLKEGYMETTIEQEVIVEVEKGMLHNTKIVRESLGDMHPGTQPGDLVFVVVQQEHPVYKRKGHDLLIKKDISLAQALCGLSYEVQKLDGTTVRVENLGARAGCIKPNSIMVVEDLGMPKPGTLEFGRLFVNFTVVFPETPLSRKEREAIRAAVPRIPHLDTDDDAREPSTPFAANSSSGSSSSNATTGEEDKYQETFQLEHADPNTFGHMDADERGAYDSDEDMGGGGFPGGGQCRQM